MPTMTSNLRRYRVFADARYRLGERGFLQLLTFRLILAVWFGDHLFCLAASGFQTDVIRLIRCWRIRDGWFTGMHGRPVHGPQSIPLCPVLADGVVRVHLIRLALV